MIHLLKKLYYKYILNRHLCEEFTRWEKKEYNVERPATIFDNLRDINITVLTYTKKYQERQCTICGKIYQEKLEF